MDQRRRRRRVSDYAGWRAAFIAAMDLRLHSADWLDWMAMTGRARLAANERAAILFEVKVYPTGARMVHGLVAAGGLESIVTELIPQAEAYARAIGAIGCIIESREGWSRSLRGSGYEPHQLQLRKMFDGGQLKQD